MKLFEPLKRVVRKIARRVLSDEIETLQRSLEDELEKCDTAEAIAHCRETVIVDLRAQLARWSDAQRNMVTLAETLRQANLQVRYLHGRVDVYAKHACKCQRCTHLLTAAFFVHDAAFDWNEA